MYVIKHTNGMTHNRSNYACFTDGARNARRTRLEILVINYSAEVKLLL